MDKLSSDAFPAPCRMRMALVFPTPPSKSLTLPPTRTHTATADGNYTITNLPAGTHTVEAEAKDIKKRSSLARA